MRGVSDNIFNTGIVFCGFRDMLKLPRRCASTKYHVHFHHICCEYQLQCLNEMVLIFSTHNMFWLKEKKSSPLIHSFGEHLHFKFIIYNDSLQYGKPKFFVITYLLNVCGPSTFIKNIHAPRFIVKMKITVLLQCW